MWLYFPSGGSSLMDNLMHKNEGKELATRGGSSLMTISCTKTRGKSWPLVVVPL